MKDLSVLKIQWTLVKRNLCCCLATGLLNQYKENSKFHILWTSLDHMKGAHFMLRDGGHGYLKLIQFWIKSFICGFVPETTDETDEGQVPPALPQTFYQWPHQTAPQQQHQMMWQGFIWNRSTWASHRRKQQLEFVNTSNCWNWETSPQFSAQTRHICQSLDMGWSFH